MDLVKFQLQKNNHSSIKIFRNTLSFTFLNSEEFPEIKAKFEFQENVLTCRTFEIPNKQDKNLRYFFSDFFKTTGGKVEYEEDNQVKMIFNDRCLINSASVASEIVKKSIIMINEYLNNQSRNPMKFEECFYLKSNELTTDFRNPQNSEILFNNFDLIFNLDVSNHPRKVMALIPDPRNNSEFFFYEEDFNPCLQVVDYMQKFSAELNK